MDKQLQADLAQMTMYSKMGRYISSKILKYNKNPSITLRNRPYHTQVPVCHQKNKKAKELNQTSNISPLVHEHHKSWSGPPVGYYKISHDYVTKNPRTYNFNRSVPHFYRNNYLCNQTKPVIKDYPDVSPCRKNKKSMVDLNRIVGRNQIKGSIRKFIDDPHQNRFLYIKEKFQTKTTVNMEKQLSRDNRMFKNYEFTPEYNYDYSVNMKRLDTNIIPFGKNEGRDGSCLKAQTGISDCFPLAEQNFCSDHKQINMKRILPREKTGATPSYMDKNINTRTSISLLNLKSFEMNCSKLKKYPKEGKKKNKEKIFYEEKQNLMQK